VSSLASHPDIKRAASLLRSAVVEAENALFGSPGEFPIRRSELEAIHGDIATAVRLLERLR